MNRLCWICNVNEADSEEHKFKASDLKKRFGKKFDAYHIVDSSFNQANSYKDKAFKYNKIICTDCNNNKTRQADDAYDVFIHKISEDPYGIIENEKINFEILYGADWREGKRNLLSYVAKHIGCEIKSSPVRENVDVKNLSSFILGTSDYLDFSVNFIVNHLLFDYIEESRRLDNLKIFNPLGFSDTVYFTFKNRRHFSGTMINNIYRIEWIFLNSGNLLSKNSLNDRFENLEILNEEVFYKDSFLNRTNDDFIMYLLRGVYNNTDSYIDYIKSKFERDFG